MQMSRHAQMGLHTTASDIAMLPILSLVKWWHVSLFFGQKSAALLFAAFLPCSTTEVQLGYLDS